MSDLRPSLQKRIVAEALGTGFLVAAVVGSGITGERLSGGNIAIALLANTLATGAALVALILTFGPISGAHLNPVVTLCMGLRRLLPWKEVMPYVSAQFIGGMFGTLLAHVMFGRELYSISQHQRSGLPQLVSEFVAALGLLCVIWGCLNIRSALAVPIAVASYITVLVYRLNIVRKSRRHSGAFRHGYLRGHPPGRCTGLHCGSSGWCSGCDRRL
jgi:glycerol uptake facilitator-like aquaporin